MRAMLSFKRLERAIHLILKFKVKYSASKREVEAHEFKALNVKLKALKVKNTRIKAYCALRS